MMKVRKLDGFSFAIAFGKIGLLVGTLFGAAGLVLFRQDIFGFFMIMLSYGIASFVTAYVFAILYNKFFRKKEELFDADLVQ